MSSFLGKKIKYKFKVDLQLRELTAVPYANSLVFAKVRLLDGGSFHDFSVERPVRNTVVAWSQDFQFQCKMTASAATCMLDECRCRVSIRMIIKGNREKIKLGFCDVNLAEYASGIQDPQSYLLQPYNASQRLGNMILHVRALLTLQSENPVFKAPARTPFSALPSATSATTENRADSFQRLSQQQQQQRQRTSSGEGDDGFRNLLDSRVSAFPGGEVVVGFDSPDAMAPQLQLEEAPQLQLQQHEVDDAATVSSRWKREKKEEEKKK